MAATGRVLVWRLFLLLVSSVVVMVLVEGKTVDDVRERANLAAETIQDAKETTESWADWAKEMITEGLRYRHENAMGTAQRIMDKAGQMAESAKQRIAQAAYGAMDSTSDMTGEIKDAMKDQAEDVAEKVADGKAQRTDAAEQAYEEQTAKDAMTTNGKHQYEHAEEKYSQVTGDVGEYMQERAQEL